VAAAEGDYEGARKELQESIATWQGAGRPDMVQHNTTWALAGLGRAEYGRGNRDQAQQRLLEALEIAVELRTLIPLLHLVPIVALVLADAEEAGLKIRAAELHGLCMSHPFLSRAQLFEDIAWRQIRAGTASLPSDVVAAAQERGRALDWWATAEALLRELRGWRWIPGGD
jgi:tetratricopeptide (TPR) repeat protein